MDKEDLNTDLLNTITSSHMQQQLKILALEEDVKILMQERDEQRERDDKILHTN